MNGLDVMEARVSMAYDEGLAERIREQLREAQGISERKMFGGLAFMVHGNMAVGIVKDTLMVRVGPTAFPTLLREPHARPMDFTGKPSKGMLYVDPAGVADDADLARWVEHGLRFAEGLPRK